jgi:hypothetical protein
VLGVDDGADAVENERLELNLRKRKMMGVGF